MSTIVTRAGKGSPLTWNEVDNNFTNLNTDKLQSGNTAAALTITSATINGGTITGTALNGTLGVTTPSTIAATTISGTDLTTTGNTILGNASTDTLNVGNGGLVKDASGNVGIGTASPGTKLQVLGGTSVGATWGTNQYIRVDGSSGASYSAAVATTGNTVSGYYISNPTNAYEAGIDYEGTNKFLTFRTNNAERMRINSSGNVGIGVTPSAWSGVLALQTNGGSLYSYLTTDVGLTQNGYFDGTNWKYVNTAASSSYFQSVGTHIWRTAPSGTAGNTITYVDRMTLDINGNLGLGVTPSAWSSTYRAINVGVGGSFSTGASAITYAAIGANYFDNGASRYIGTGAATLYAQNSGQHIFYTAASGTAGNAITFTQAMTLDATGRLMVNQTSASAAGAGSKCQIATDVLATGSLAGLFFENRSGGVTVSTNWYGWYSTGTIYMFNGAANIASINPSTGAYTALSDVNKKKDFEPSLLGLNEILKLKPTLYRMKDAENDSPKELGLIAQEVQDVIPQAYFENTSLDAVGKESTFIGLNDRAIVATLVKAIQEQQAMIDELKAKVAALEAA